MTLFEAAARRAAASYRPALRALDGRSRAQAAVAVLPEESRFAELNEGDILEIHEFDRVYRRIAENHRDACRVQTADIGQLRGAEVALQGSQWDGDACCRFRPRNDPATPSAPVALDS